MNLDVDYLSGTAWDDEMEERMRWLRENDPVHWSEKSGVFIISKYDDVVAVSKNPKLFCSGQGVRPNIEIRQGLIDEDAPKHTALRKLINRGFTPRMVDTLEPVFRRITTEAIDKVASRGECDFVDDIAVPLPLMIIAEMIGIRKEDRYRFHEWSDAMIAGDGNFDDPEIMQKAAAAFVAYSTYVTEIIEDRRKNPKDDLISILTGAKDSGFLVDFDQEAGDIVGDVDGDHLDMANDELIMLLVTLMVAGNETTRNALSGAVRLLIEHPDARQQLIDDPSLIPDAIEELLRHVTPILSFSRTATEDTELRGKKIEKGDKVLMLYPSANRDADQYEAPDELRLDRRPQHVAFGIGAHFCLGANLARMELRVALEEILRRMPDMELAGEAPEYRPNALVRSCVHMNVRFTPEPSA
jgi:cytochrome P450 family 142 subfamily A polypeptide 1